MEKRASKPADPNTSERPDEFSKLSRRAEGDNSNANEHAPPTPRGKPGAIPPPRLSPEASAALAAASAALAAFEDPPARRPPAEAGTAAPTKLIDLFPPVGAEPVSPSPAPSSAVPVAAGSVAGRAEAAPAAKARAPYEKFYGLAESPFDQAPDPRFQFHWLSFDRVLRELAAAIGRHDGSMVLTGGPGAGKTTLCRALVAQLGRRTLVSCVGGALAARDVLQTVLVDFGVLSRADAASGSLRKASGHELASTLREFLASIAALQAVALVVIDDAQALQADVLGELQVLSEIAAEHKLLQVLLVGEPGLADALQSADLDAWNNRIGIRVELAPLAEGEVADYVAHRLAVAGATEDLFDEGALARVHALSRGMLRSVNLLCDRALALGQRASARSVDADLVDRAARELGLLPETPPSAPSLRGRMLLVASMLALMLAGAAGAGWMFREPLLRVLARWHVVWVRN